jgi:MOSC domain-containing protein YiiM
MDLLSVNLGQERALQTKDRVETTGIFKVPATGTVRITALGLQGDFIASRKHHGGHDQAIYIYGTADYDWWARELGIALDPGTFGDNLTVGGLESASLRVGDRLQVGAATLQVTAPRIPCATLAARMGDPQFVKRFRHAERPGLYCRVLQEGPVQAGDPVTVEPFAGETVTILEMFRDYYGKGQNEAELRRYLAAPIAIRSRVEKEEQLKALLAGK